jgi:hypothetical protein
MLLVKLERYEETPQQRQGGAKAAHPFARVSCAVILQEMHSFFSCLPPKADAKVRCFPRCRASFASFYSFPHPSFSSPLTLTRPFILTLPLPPSLVSLRVRCVVSTVFRRRTANRWQP